MQITPIHQRVVVFAVTSVTRRDAPFGLQFLQSLEESHANRWLHGPNAASVVSTDYDVSGSGRVWRQDRSLPCRTSIL